VLRYVGKRTWRRLSTLMIDAAPVSVRYRRRPTSTRASRSHASSPSRSRETPAAAPMSESVTFHPGGTIVVGERRPSLGAAGL